MEKNVTYSINGNDFNNLLKDLKLKEEEALLDKYYSVLIPTAWVTQIHEVDPSTVCRYVQRGLLNLLSLLRQIRVNIPPKIYNYVQRSKVQ